jgi:hypothetical protein
MVSFMRIIVLVSIAGASFLLAAAAIGGAPGQKFAQETASGDYAIAVVGGNVDRPRAIYVKVKARPAQRVDVAWLAVCSKGYGAGSKDGDLTGRTPLVRRIRLPYDRPDSCTASASAQLADGGFVKVQLYATH